MLPLQINRLIHLREVAQRIPPGLIDMGAWVVVPNKIGYLPREEIDDCSTAACLGGWACRDREFQEQGLYISQRSGVCPAYELADGFQALQIFFGLTVQETNWLFHAESYQYSDAVESYHEPSREELVEHIEQVIVGALRIPSHKGTYKQILKEVNEEVGADETF